MDFSLFLEVKHNSHKQMSNLSFVMRKNSDNINKLINLKCLPREGLCMHTHTHTYTHTHTHTYKKHVFNAGNFGEQLLTTNVYVVASSI